MNKLSKLAVCLAVTLSGNAIVSTSFAATATTTIPITAIVIDSCVVVASPLTFGNYNGISGGMLDAAAAITPICTSGTAYSIAIDAGLGSGATMTSRILTGPDGATLNYGIFTDTNRLTVWGDGTGGTSWVVASGVGLAQPVTMYGRVPAGQAATVGAYSDTLTITVSY